MHFTVLSILLLLSVTYSFPLFKAFGMGTPPPRPPPRGPLDRIGRGIQGFVAKQAADAAGDATRHHARMMALSFAGGAIGGQVGNVAVAGTKALADASAKSLKWSAARGADAAKALGSKAEEVVDHISRQVKVETPVAREKFRALMEKDPKKLSLNDRVKLFSD